MQESFLVSPWARLFLSLALELLFVFGLAAVAVRLLRQATLQRTLWRPGFVTTLLLGLVELAGFGHAALQSARRTPEVGSAPARVSFTVTLSPVTLPLPAMTETVQVSATPPEMPKAAEPLWPTLIPLAGILVLVLRRLRNRRALRGLVQGEIAVPHSLQPRLDALARRMGCRTVHLRETERLVSPIAFGMFRPVIAVPAGFATRHSAAQQDAMLAHELAHVGARDGFWAFGADLTVALFWWHPLVWWARNRHRAACETAADEASLLLDNGPAVLAECLVALGRELAGGRVFGGLGMAEHRFRSDLGRRVERLLALREREWRPWRCPKAWLTRLVVPTGFAALALAAAAWLLPRDARAASLSHAFHRSALRLVTTTLLAADENDVPRLILQGKKLFDAGKTNEARRSGAKPSNSTPPTPSLADTSLQS